MQSIENYRLRRSATNSIDESNNSSGSFVENPTVYIDKEKQKAKALLELH